MKHRSVIAFVIVAAALVAAPQLSHDLQALRGSLASRLHVELLHAFLNMPAGAPTAAAPAAFRSPQTLLASCTKGRAAGPAAKPGRVAPRTQRAMIDNPQNDPIIQKGGAAKGAPAAEIAAALPEALFEAEVAMIIPPDAGIGPHAVQSVHAYRSAALEGAKRARVEAESERAATFAARSEVANVEWRKVGEELSRRVNLGTPGAYEFRVVHDGQKMKVVKVKCAECPAPAPRLPRAPRQVAAGGPRTAPPPPAPADGE